MYNLRYHIASLVAVFLALAMGLLLGTIVVDRGVIAQQQAKLVSDLQKSFNEIRTESAAVKKSNQTLTAFANDAMSGLVGSTLTTRTIVVIASPENGSTADLVTKQVKAAGGSTAVATFNAVDLGLTDDKVAAAAAKALGIPAGSVTTSMVVDALAIEWRTAGDARLVTKALVSSGALKFTGLAATGAVDGCVVTCSFSGKPDGAALLLASQISDPLRPAVGVEATDHADGTAAAAAAAGLSAVDDIDTPMGQVSLAWVLSRRASGYFGEGSGAEAAYPTPLFGAK